MKLKEKVFKALENKKYEMMCEFCKDSLDAINGSVGDPDRLDEILELVKQGVQHIFKEELVIEKPSETKYIFKVNDHKFFGFETVTKEVKIKRKDVDKVLEALENLARNLGIDVDSDEE